MVLWRQPGVPLWFFHWVDCLQMKEFGGGLIHDFPNNLRSSARLSPVQFLVDGVCRFDDQQFFVQDELGTITTIILVAGPELLSPTLQHMASSSGGAHHEPVLQRSDNETDVSLRHRSMHLLSHKTYELIPNSGKVIALDVEVAVNRHFMLCTNSCFCHVCACQAGGPGGKKGIITSKE